MLVPSLAQWQQLADKFYSKEKIYAPLAWEGVHLQHLLVASAKNGGPIAVTRHPFKVIPLGISQPLADSSIHIYNAAGCQLAAVDWTHEGGKLVKMGWSDEESLVCVTEEGFVFVFDVRGRLIRRLEFGAECYEQGVADAVIFEAERGESLRSESGGVASSSSSSSASAAAAAAAAGRGGGGEEEERRGGGVVCITESNQMFLMLLNEPEEEPRKLPCPQLKSAPLAVSVVVRNTSTLEDKIAPETLEDKALLRAGSSGGSREGGSSSGSSSTSNVAVLVAAGAIVMAVGRGGVESESVSIGPVLRMATSPSGKLLGCFTHEGRLLVLLSDLSQVLFQLDTESVLPPDQLAWCGEDAVAMSWDEVPELLLVGPGGSIRFAYDDHDRDEGEDSKDLNGRAMDDAAASSLSPPFPSSSSSSSSASSAMLLISEIDCLRVLTNKRMEIVRKVPACLVSSFGIGSTSPSALLLDAFDHFCNRSIKADETIRAMGDELADAVAECIKSAEEEWSAERQKLLLRAAAYGKAFCRHFPRDLLRSSCRLLRVINSIRSKEGPGIPLSLAQFKESSPQRLLHRLATLHHHLLAIRIAAELQLPSEPILEHWAAAKIASSVESSDEELLLILRSKLKDGPRVSFADVAAAAFRRHRVQLASLLLEDEVRAERAVLLLLAMGQEEAALGRAEESSDPDLILAVLFKLLQTLQEEMVLNLLQAHPLARSTFVAFARQDPSHHDLLKRLFKVAGQPQAVAELIAHDALNSLHVQSADDTSSPSSSLQQSAGGASRQVKPKTAAAAAAAAAVHDLQQAAQLFGQSRDMAVHSRFLEEEAKLLKFQQHLEATLASSPSAASAAPKPLLGLSVAQTIRLCIEAGSEKDAAKLRSDFKVSEKSFYWIKLAALSSSGQWEALEKFSREKRPPIGHRAFAEACMEQGANREAAKYIAKIIDANEKEELYKRIGMVEEAAEAASSAKEGNLFGSISSTLGSTIGSSISAAQPSALLGSWMNLNRT